MIGKTLDQYLIQDRIGIGGMGEVYRAHDTNLDRDVAVKVLPQELADNPDRLARLEREAKAIATLSHPNILAVYDFGSAEGSAYIVTELLKGETLRDRLAGGALPARKATEYGRQIARGLAAAHDRGIVHRDLKPENLFLTHEGRVKILDFGLATEAVDANPADVGATVDMASDPKLTTPGAVLGTVDYMSPEQVRGQPTDPRSDLFSFGSVLYEMISGHKPFSRETTAETMTAILREEPADLTDAAAALPPGLVAIIGRCLEKRPGERFHSAHDLAFSLEALSGSNVATGSATALTGVSSPRRRPAAAVVAGLVLVGMIVGMAGAWFLRPDSSGTQGLNFATLSSRRGTVTNARFTQGEDNAVFSAAWGDEPLRLFSVSSATPNPSPLNLVSCDLLSVSSTGEYAVALDRRSTLGWEVFGTLAVVQPGGTTPRPVIENVLFADWSPDGKSLAVAREVDGVVRLEYPIGTVLYESPGWISDVRMHPDGDRVLIADNPGRGDNLARVKVIHLDGRVEDFGIGGSWGVLWDLDGRSVITFNGAGMFRLRPGKDPVWITDMPNSLRLMDMAPTGRILAGSSVVRREMIGLAPGAGEEQNLSWLDWSTPSALSDDGTLALLEEGNDFKAEGYAVYLRPTDGAAPLHLGYGSVMALSPDNSRVALIKRPFSEDQGLVLVPTGTGEPREVSLQGLRVANKDGGWVLGPDGGPDAIVVPARLGDGPLRIFYLPLDGTTPPRAVTPADFPLAAQGHVVAVDGQRVVVMPSSGPAVAFTMAGEGPRPLEGLLASDLPLKLDRDGRHLYVQSERTLPSPIYKVNTETGERELHCELSPSDPAGVSIIDRVRMSADGEAYVYSIRRNISKLVVVNGVH